jgi:DNA-binding transcriptional MocR family regulator
LYESRATALAGAIRKYLPYARFLGIVCLPNQLVGSSSLLVILTCVEPRGGYFLWLELPAGVNVNDAQLLVVAKKFGVNFKMGSLCAVAESSSSSSSMVPSKADIAATLPSPSGQSSASWEIDYTTPSANNCLRLCFARYPAPLLVEAVQRLADAIKLVRNDNNRSCL